MKIFVGQIGHVFFVDEIGKDLICCICQHDHDPDGIIGENITEIQTPVDISRKDRHQFASFQVERITDWVTKRRCGIRKESVISMTVLSSGQIQIKEIIIHDPSVHIGLMGLENFRNPFRQEGISETNRRQFKAKRPGTGTVGVLCHKEKIGLLPSGSSILNWSTITGEKGRDKGVAPWSSRFRCLRMDQPLQPLPIFLHHS
jgi:hypothetical protein